MPRVDPEVLRWARETADLSLKEAARKLGFRDSTTRTAVERLQALEAGKRPRSSCVREVHLLQDGLKARFAAEWIEHVITLQEGEQEITLLIRLSQKFQRPLLVVEAKMDESHSCGRNVFGLTTRPELVQDAQSLGPMTGSSVDVGEPEQINRQFQIAD